MESDKAEEVEALIRQYYGVENPDFAYCVAGTRKVYVNPADPRARWMLLSKGPRYFSRPQAFLYSCMRLLPVGRFIDVGVNYGECLMAVPFNADVEIIGFEANTSLMPFIERTIAANDDLKRVTVHNLAVSDRPAEFVEFHINPNWSGMSSLAPRTNEGDATVMRVGMTTLDDAVGTANPPKLLLIKVDVEGFEPFVIDGARRLLDSVDNVVILLEWDSRFIQRAGVSPAAFFDRLRPQFSISTLDRTGIKPASEYRDLAGDGGDNTEVHTDLILSRFSDQALQTTFAEKILPWEMSALRREWFGK